MMVAVMVCVRGGFVVVMPPLCSGDTSRGGLCVVSCSVGWSGGHLGLASLGRVATVVGGCLTGGVWAHAVRGVLVFSGYCCVRGSSGFLLFRGWPSVTYCRGVVPGGAGWTSVCVWG